MVDVSDPNKQENTGLRLEAKEIKKDAERLIGISDPEDFVLGNLDRLIIALKTESQLDELGLRKAREALVRAMTHRLDGLKWIREHPEITDEPIDSPIFLMGLPRSGTTYLQYLFDLDDRFRQIRTWEALTPSPPPGADPSSAQSRRLAWLERKKQLIPQVEGFESLHLHDEDGSEECHPLLEQSFGAAGLNNLYRIPSYFEYLLDEADIELSYRVHKRQLQLLQWCQTRRPWVLKYPNHLLAVPEILRVYPDARFVMTHRDPLQVLASICKLSWKLRSARSAHRIDQLDIGRYMTRFIERHVDRIIDTANGPFAGRIVHVDYYALVRDPASELFKVHEALGIASPKSVREAVSAWHAANPKGARGENRYGFEEYGLDERSLEKRFRDYTVQFNIPRERVGLAKND